jgi:acetyl-CoA acetyltransferase
VLLSPENVRNYCLGRIGRDIVCLLQAGMRDVAKREKHKLEIQEAMVHIMAPTTKHTKFADYEVPALAVATLKENQFGELTQDQHPVNDWNRIMLAIKAGIFENELEYEEIKQRSSKKSVFSQSFIPRKNVKFGLEVLVPTVQEIKLGAELELLWNIIMQWPQLWAS